MRRAPLVLGFTSSAIAATLIALAYGIDPHQAPSTVEPMRGEAARAQLTSSVDTELNESKVVVPQRSEGDFQNPMVTKTISNTSLVDEETSRKMVREEATRDTQKIYSILLEGLELTPSEKDALLSFLTEDLMANTRTRHSSGKGMDQHERSKRIAAIIGESKLQQFLVLERNRREYAEVQKMSSMLQQKGAPLTTTQRDGLLRILVDVRVQVNAMPTADAKPQSIESHQHRLNQIAEYERLVLELASSVLTPRQVQYMFEQYQALSYKRTDVLEIQKRARAGSASEEVPLWYPASDVPPLSVAD